MVESPLTKGLATVKQIQIPNIFIFIANLVVCKKGNGFANLQMSMLKHIGQLDVDCLVQLSKIFIENKQEHVTSIQTPAKTMKVCGFF